MFKFVMKRWLARHWRWFPLFAVSFVGVVVRTFAQGKDSPRSAHLAQLPLADDYLEPAHNRAVQESER